MLDQSYSHVTLSEIPSDIPKAELYQHLVSQVESLFAEEHDFIANLANFSALIYQTLPNLNWVGFYLLRGDELVLGPFQGKVACVRIPMGNGVCGTAAQKRETIVVPDVHQFPGHIACDSASQSEVVIPLINDGQLWGVLDLDSPHLNRFDGEDASGLEMLASRLMERTEIPSPNIQ